MPIALSSIVRLRPGGHFGFFARGMAAYGSAELVGRVVRLATTVVIARQLTPDIVGAAALALSLFELVRVLERVGTGQQIVVASRGELAAVCNTVSTIYQAWCLALVVLQLGLAVVLASLFDNPVAGGMLAALSVVYLFMARGHVPYFLAMREGKVARLAGINAIQGVADQAFTLVLMLLWPSPWAIVIPKILVAPIWLAAAVRTHPWRPDRSAGTLPLRQVLRSSGSLLLADAISALRTQGDNLLVAAMLGTSVLGSYFFAYNAGLGIVSSLVGALGSVLFPALSRAAHGTERRVALTRALVCTGLLFGPLVLVQALAAPYYVPLVFGMRWAPVSSLVSILCIAGLAFAFNQVTSSFLRAEGRMERDAANSALNCSLTLGGLALGAASGQVEAAAWGMVLGGATATILIAVCNLVPILLKRDAPLPAVQLAKA
ncbi:oligosaccharide flippase family protein [Novosphingobium profundi]|uniref:oligosaccharide flippase family protein n=1 Tax=Novosphingobium profundi TaxID=1774954 RepID=UPI001BDA186F|nr:oligosaccharide flippase family protein [Novosphingobium profundi]MBT0670095.1 oligosaccharide flippase family protein [Novosphingobium profundi]